MNRNVYLVKERFDSLIDMQESLTALHQRLQALEARFSQSPPQFPSQVPLTEEEVHLLTLLAQTATLKELAEFAGYHQKTVQRRIENLCGKCRVEHHHQLIVFGTMLGHCMLTDEVEPIV